MPDFIDLYTEMRFTLVQFFILVALVFHNLLYSQDCKDKRKDVLLEPFSHENRLNGTLGICYAAATADYLDYMLLKNKINLDSYSFSKGDRVSSLDLAASHLIKVGRSDFKDNPSGLSGGHSMNILWGLEDSEIKVCLERDSNIEKREFSSQAYENLFSKVADLNLAKCKADELTLLNLKDTFGLTAENLLEILKELDQDRRVAKLIKSSCKKSYSVDLSKRRPKFLHKKKKKIFKKVNKFLEKGEPILMSFYSDYLSRSEYGQENSHVALVIGRRVNPLTCKIEYLIKDNESDEPIYDYADNRNHYLKNLSTLFDCKKLEDPEKCMEDNLIFPEGVRVENKLLIIEEDNLEKMVSGISFLE